MKRQEENEEQGKVRSIGEPVVELEDSELEKVAGGRSSGTPSKVDREQGSLSITSYQTGGSSGD